MSSVDCSMKSLDAVEWINLPLLTPSSKSRSLKSSMSSKLKKHMPNVICHNCGGCGHYQKDCPSAPEEEQKNCDNDGHASQEIGSAGTSYPVGGYIDKEEIAF